LVSNLPTPDAVVDRAYELISFEAGDAPQWDAFRALFTQPAVLALRVFPGDDHIRVLDLDGYQRVQMRDDLERDGYTEVPLHRDVRITGDLAEVRVEFEMRFPHGPPALALDVFVLVRRGGPWLIASIASEILPAAEGSAPAPARRDRLGR
jgi:hypothetical protein